ncbi:hypothetical protein B566_EDAN006498 [Ephemera danica]|nr:hypothetical protein B566_EDAN006498 [Ephemera danica]
MHLGQSSSQQVNRTTAPVTPIVTERPATASVPSNQGQEGWNWYHATQQQFLAASAAQMPTMAAYPHAAMAHLYDPVNIAQMQHIYSQYMAHLQQAGVSAEALGTMHAQAQQNWNVHPNQTPPVPVPDVNPIVPANANPQANVPAAPQMIGADDDEMRLGRQRDWLDWFYVLSRLLVLFSIVYFYSSLKRFVLVSALGILLYLYHLGYFRMQPIGVAEAENNQPPREAVPEAQVEDQNGPDRAEEQEAAVGEPDGVRQRRPDNANPAEENVPAPNQSLPPPVETPSAFMLTWTFVTSFFASLIPDRPNVV